MQKNNKKVKPGIRYIYLKHFKKNLKNRVVINKIEGL